MPCIVDADQTTFVKRSHRGVPQRSRPGRFLGDLVRPLQAAHPRAGAGDPCRRPGRVKLVKVDIDKNRGARPAIGPHRPAACSPCPRSPHSGRARSPTCSRARCRKARSSASSNRCSSSPAAPCRRRRCWRRRKPRWPRASAAGRWRPVQRRPAGPSRRTRRLGAAWSVPCWRSDEEGAGAGGARARCRPRSPSTPDVAGARSALALGGRGTGVRPSGLAAFTSAGSRPDPADHQARYELASALNATGQREDAAAALLEIIRRDRSWNEGAARLQLLKFFEAWGNGRPSNLASRAENSRRYCSADHECIASFERRRSCLRNSPIFPLAGRAVAAAGQAAAEHLRASATSPWWRTALAGQRHDRDDPAGWQPTPNVATESRPSTGSAAWAGCHVVQRNR